MIKFIEDRIYSIDTPCFILQNDVRVCVDSRAVKPMLDKNNLDEGYANKLEHLRKCRDSTLKEDEVIVVYDKCMTVLPEENSIIITPDNVVVGYWNCVRYRTVKKEHLPI